MLFNKRIFAEFKQNIASTLFYSFNELIDKITWDNDFNFNDLSDFLTTFNSINFVNIVREIFEHHYKSYKIKELYGLKSKNVVDISYDKDVALEKYKQLNDKCRHFVQFLFTSPIKLFYNMSEKYNSLTILNENMFDVFLNEKLTRNLIDDECLFGELSLVDYITNTNIVLNYLTRVEITNIDDMASYVSQIHLILDYRKVSGNNNVSSFSQALTVMAKIAPVWEQLKISSATQDDEENDEEIVEDENVNIDEVVEAYKGNYSVVPSNYPAAKTNAYGLVSNFVNFNRLSADRQLQVSNYLMKNRRVFNEAIEDSCNIIDKQLNNELNNVDYGTDTMLNKNMNILKNTYRQICNDNDIRKKINYICRIYVPLVNKYSSVIVNKYGKTHANDVMSNNNSLFSVNLNNEEITPEIISGIYSNTEDMSGGGYKEHLTINRPTYQTSSLIEDMTSAQHEFNKSFETLYRKLIQDIQKVNFGNPYKHETEELYALTKVFDDICINEAKTTIYLSGLYGKCDRNRVYRDVVQSTINTLKTSGIQSFASAISTLGQMVNLLDKSYKKADDLRNKYIRSKRVTGDMLIIAGKHVKIPCNLNAKDFNDFEQAVRRLRLQLKSPSSDSNLLSNRAEFEKYLKNIDKRADYINEKFKEFNNSLEYSSHMSIKNPEQRQIFVKTKMMLYEFQRKKLLYINNVVDKYFTKQKINNEYDKTLTDQQIAKIEQHITTFKRNRMPEKWKKEFKELNKMLVYNADLFEIIKQLKKIFSEGRYVEFISSIYKDFFIDTNGLNWKEFDENMVDLCVASCVDVDWLYKLPSKDNTHLQTFVNFMTDMYFIAAKELSDSNYKETRDVGGKKIEKIFKFSDYVESNYEILSKLLKNDALPILEKILTNKEAEKIVISTDDAKKLYIHFVKTLLQRDETDGIDTTFEMPGCTITRKYVEIFKKELTLEPEKKMMGVSIYFADMWDNKLNCFKIPELIHASLDGIMVNIISAIDNYWRIRYTGKLDLPTNIDNLLQDYNYQRSATSSYEDMTGGGLFDGNITSFKRRRNVVVIPEAGPFYICALNICKEYITKLLVLNNKTDRYSDIDEKIPLSDKEYENKHKVSKDYKQYMKFSTISVLYPIVELIGVKKISFETMTTEQLEDMIEIFNGMWTSATGTNSQKLSTAIDVLLSELSAAIIFSDNIQKEFIENNYKITNIISEKLISNIDEIKNIVENMLKDSIDLNYDTNYSEENERIGFENMLKRAYLKLKDTPEHSRINKLKDMLTNITPESITERFGDFYKFMDLVFSPLLICYISYINVFKLFDAMVIYNEHDFNAYVGTYNLNNEKIVINGITWTVWDLINKADLTPEDKIALMNHPIYQIYNQVLINNMLFNYSKTGKFIAPVFWDPKNRETYPTMATFGTSVISKQNVQTARVYSLQILRQLWPNLKVNTVADYFEIAINEFLNDVHNCVFNFLAYPGINQRSMKQIQTFLGSDKSADRLRLTYDSLIKNDEIIAFTEILKQIPVTKEDVIIPSPLTRINKYINVPTTYIDDMLFIGVSYMPQTNTINETYTDEIKQNKTNKSINIEYPDKDTVAMLMTWTDYVIYTIAKMEEINYVVPIRLIERMRENYVLNQIIKPVVLNDKEYVVNYSLNKHNEKICLNVLTQNIVARSLTPSNNSHYDLYPQRAINNIIAILPYLINNIQSVLNSLKTNIYYTFMDNNNNEYKTLFTINDELAALLTVLNRFYNEISSKLTPLSFLQTSFEQGTQMEHPIGEVIKYLDIDINSNILGRDFSRFEWANKYMFNNLNLTFHDYINKDKLSWLKSYAKTTFSSPAFNSNFKYIFENIGKQLWYSLISNQFKFENETKTYPNVTQQLYLDLMSTLKTFIELNLHTRQDLQDFLDVVFYNYNSEKTDEQTKYINLNLVELRGGGLDVSTLKSTLKDKKSVKEKLDILKTYITPKMTSGLFRTIYDPSSLNEPADFAFGNGNTDSLIEKIKKIKEITPLNIKYENIEIKNNKVFKAAPDDYDTIYTDTSDFENNITKLNKINEKIKKEKDPISETNIKEIDDKLNDIKNFLTKIETTANKIKTSGSKDTALIDKIINSLKTANDDVSKIQTNKIVKSAGTTTTYSLNDTKESLTSTIDDLIKESNNLIYNINKLYIETNSNLFSILYDIYTNSPSKYTDVINCLCKNNATIKDQILDVATAVVMFKFVFFMYAVYNGINLNLTDLSYKDVYKDIATVTLSTDKTKITAINITNDILLNSLKFVIKNFLTYTSSTQTIKILTKFTDFNRLLKFIPEAKTNYKEFIENVKNKIKINKDMIEDEEFMKLLYVESPEAFGLIAKIPKFCQTYNFFKFTLNLLTKIYNNKYEQGYNNDFDALSYFADDKTRTLLKYYYSCLLPNTLTFVDQLNTSTDPATKNFYDSFLVVVKDSSSGTTTPKFNNLPVTYKGMPISIKSKEIAPYNYIVKTSGTTDVEKLITITDGMTLVGYNFTDTKIISNSFVEHIDIFRFLSHLINKDIKSFINVNVKDTRSIGFLNPEIKRFEETKQLTGGGLYDEFGFLPYFINIDKLNGFKGVDKLESLYKGLNLPYRLYQNIYNNAKYIAYNDGTSIFTITMKYFKKFNITNSSIFSHIMYLSLFMNSYIYKQGLQRLSVAAMNLPDTDKTDEWSKYYKLIKHYISVIAEKDSRDGKISTVYDYLNDHSFQFLVDKIIELKRKNVYTIDDFYKLTHPLDLSYIKFRPSINNNFIKELYDNMIDKFNKRPEIYKLLHTPMFDYVRRLDFDSTFITILMMWVKLTSYTYTDEKYGERTYGFFGEIPTSPFDSAPNY